MKNSLIENSTELKRSILDTEKVLLDRAIEWAREAFKQFLEQIDSSIQRHRSASFRIAHKRSIWYRTCLGPIRVNRRLYQDQDGKYRCLLDELMGMDKYRHTTVTVKEITCRLAGEMPFRKSAEILKETTLLIFHTKQFTGLFRRPLLTAKMTQIRLLPGLKKLVSCRKLKAGK